MRTLQSTHRSFLSGPGTFGSHHIWPFDGPLDAPGTPKGLDWRAGMDRPASQEMPYVKALFDGRKWHKLVPDQEHTLVGGGYGNFTDDDRTGGGDYVAAARTPDGRFAMAYAPPTGAEKRTISVDMSRLAGPVNAGWYNPTTGEISDLPGSPFDNIGKRDFETPGDNGTGTNDWVLVLESASVSQASRH